MCAAAPCKMWTIAVGDGADAALYPISLQAARLADLLRDELNDGEVPDEPFHLPSDFFAKAVQATIAFLELAATHPPFTITKPLPEGGLADAGCPAWATDFLAIPRDGAPGPGGAPGGAVLPDDVLDWPLLFAMLRLAAYVQAEGLLQLLAARIGARIKGWTPAQQEVIFDAPKLSPSEEEALRRSEAWAETEPELEAELRRRATASALAATAGLRGAGSGAAPGASV